MSKESKENKNLEVKTLHGFIDGTQHNIKENSTIAKYFQLLRANKIDIVQDQGSPGSVSIQRTINKDYCHGYSIISISIDESLEEEEIKHRARRAQRIIKDKLTPVLIKQGDKAYIYGCSENNEWKLTQLDSEIIDLFDFPDIYSTPIVKTEYQIKKAIYEEISTNQGHYLPPNRNDKFYMPGPGSESDNEHKCPGEVSALLNKDKTTIKREIEINLKQEQERQKQKLEDQRKQLISKYVEKLKQINLTRSEFNDELYFAQIEELTKQHDEELAKLDKWALNPQLIEDFYGVNYPTIGFGNKTYRALANGEGREENAYKAAAIIANSNYDKIVLYGWSRGGVTAIDIANRLYDMGCITPVYLFLIDPVAGRDAGLTDENIKKLPPNIAKCTILLATGDDSKEFHPQSLEDKRLQIVTGDSNKAEEKYDSKSPVVQEKLQPNFYPVQGTHGQVAGINDGYDLVLMSVSKNISYHALKKQAAAVSAAHNQTPVLIKKGKHVFIYGDSTHDYDWPLTPLNSRIRFQVDFPSLSEGPQLQSKDQIKAEVFKEITLRNGHLPIPTKITEHHLVNFIAGIESENHNDQQGIDKTTSLIGSKQMGSVVQTGRKLLELYAKTQVEVEKYEYKLGLIEKSIIYTQEPRPFTHNLHNYTSRHNIFLNRHHQETFCLEYPELYGDLICNAITVDDLLNPKARADNEIAAFSHKYPLLNQRIIEKTPTEPVIQIPLGVTSTIYPYESEVAQFLHQYPQLKQKLNAGNLSLEDIVSPQTQQIQKLDANTKKVIITSLLLKPLDKEIVKVPNQPQWKEFKTSLLQRRRDAQHQIFSQLTNSSQTKTKVKEQDLKVIPLVVECNSAARMARDIRKGNLVDKQKAVMEFARTNNNNTRDVAAKLVAGAASLIVGIPLLTAGTVFWWGWGALKAYNTVKKLHQNIYHFLAPPSKTVARVAEQTVEAISKPIIPAKRAIRK